MELNSFGWTGGGGGGGADPVTGSGTTDYYAKFTSATAVGDGLLKDAGGSVVVMSNFLPDTNNSRSLGSSSVAFENMYTYSLDTVSTGGSDVLNIASTNADVVNIGRTSATVNTIGALSYQNTTEFQVKDKLFTINKSGAAASGGNAGFEIEENSVITGYFTTNTARNGWDFKAPAITGVATLSLASLTANRTYTLPDASGTFSLQSGTFTEGSVIFAGASGILSQSNTMFFWDNSNNILYVGANSGAFTNSKAHFEATVNSYSQVNGINKSNGTSASTDYVCTADTGTDSTNYIDLGINSSTYNDASFTVTSALDGYLYNNGGHLVIGTQTSTKSLKFHVGGTLAANLIITLNQAGSTIAYATSASANTTIASTTNATKGIISYDSFFNINGALTTVGINTSAVSNQPITSSFNVNSAIDSRFINTNTSTAAVSSISVQNSANRFMFAKYSIGYTTSGLLKASLNQINAVVGDILYSTAAASTSHIFSIAGTAASNEVGRWTPEGLAISASASSKITSPTAYLHIAAGTATAGTAPLKLTAGINNSTAEPGAFEYNGTNLFFTRTGTTREGILTQSAVTTESVVSDTTVTVNINGTTYKLLARA